MDLTAETAEAAHHWLTSQYESKLKWKESLPARIPTKTLYNHYAWHCERSGKKAIPLEDLWVIIQLAWPWVEVTGEKGNRRFTSIRRKNE